MHQHAVLFVCLGNICRSPTAEGIFRSQLENAGLSQQVMVDSAGTSNWQIDSPPDPRARQAAKARGYNLDALRGRQIHSDDFEKFDLIIAMDKSNYSDLVDLAGNNASRVHLMLDFASRSDLDEVPDPYFGEEDGFDHVIDLLEDATTGLIRHIRNSSNPKP